VTLLVGNTFVNILLTILISRIFIRHLGSAQGLVIAGVVATGAILVFGEILPKTLAVHNPVTFSLKVAASLQWIRKTLAPISGLLQRMNQKVMGVLRRILPVDDLELGDDDVKALLSLAWEEGGIGKREHALILGVFQLGETRVREVMTPRVDLFLLESNTSCRDAARELGRNFYSQIPVFSDSPDGIIGLLDAVSLLDRQNSDEPVSTLIAEPRFFPESGLAGDLLNEMLNEDLSHSIILDEYGALAGVITLEDLFEVLVGEIISNQDSDNERFSMPDTSTLIASSRFDLERAARLLGVDLTSDLVDTIGGYLMEQLGEIPEIGREYRLRSQTWTVLSAQGPVLRTIRVVKNT
jgi:putative hemolysin